LLPFSSSVMLSMAQIASLSDISASLSTLDMPAPITNLVTKSAHSLFSCRDKTSDCWSRAST